MPERGSDKDDDGERKTTNRKGKKIDITNADSEKYTSLKRSKVVIGNCFSAFSLDML